jgi:hypothetical protein
VILDEAHNARRQSPQNPKETPNRLLPLIHQKKKAVKRSYPVGNRSYYYPPRRCRLRRSKFFDLLQLLGLRGHWSYGKIFCNYFSTWHLNYQGCIYPMTFYPDMFDENASLQLMSFGNPLFEEMLKDLAPRPNCP